LVEKESLRVKIFVCRNALADGLGPRPLRRLGISGLVQAEQVPCLGKIDPRYLLKAFEGGCDAVCLVGCPVGKCRTMDGNLRAERRAVFVREILQEVGIKGQRLSFFLTEPMSENAFHEVVERFLAGAEELGPSELKTGRTVKAT